MARKRQMFATSTFRRHVCVIRAEKPRSRVAFPSSGTQNPRPTSSPSSQGSEHLPKYYFQDIPAAVMEEIVQGMERALPEPSGEEIDHWLHGHNEAATILAWYERAEEFASIHRY
jgi:hypothetical protein